MYLNGPFQEHKGGISSEAQNISDGKVNPQNAELLHKGEELRMVSLVLLPCDATCSYRLNRPWNVYLGDSCGGEEEVRWTELGPASRPDFPNRSPDSVMQIWLERCIEN